MLRFPHLLLAAALIAATPAPAAPQAEAHRAASMDELIAQYQADLGALGRLYDFPFSERRTADFRQLYTAWLGVLDGMDYASLNRADRVDWHLLHDRVRDDLRGLELDAAREAEVLPLVPDFAPLLERLHGHADREFADGEATAVAFEAMRKALATKRAELKEQKPEIGASLGRRAGGMVQQLRRACSSWMRFYAEYDPEFTWWCAQPWEGLESELRDYATFLERELGGVRPGDTDTLVGDPIGREALQQALYAERIPYTPEELIAIAEREFAWCMEERRKAASEMGLNGDWAAAQEEVKKAHPGPGDQPPIIKMLADEAVDFLEERDLLTIPALCKQVWRMQMMTPERQKFTPYFTGGEVVSISYPTEGMEHADKLMSMRGNNLHYSRAVVHHELIPGHHLQGYMAQRWNTQRRMFRSPFLVEGWALYWEMRLYDMGFAPTPEDRIGMLFWRSHRCARIIFSLKFHLGEWTPQECIDFLVENVGHERRNATAEVRRSIQGGYGPLYQAAYMTGGLQLLALHEELVENGPYSEKEFHDAVLRQNSIAIEYLRAALNDEPLPKDFPVSWRFAD
ncbi:MAG: DUF885 domain-containing protein [Planctomycetes bacterium]|nr:DUF885 domain-containing protein [Planctomycetota bacterium]